MRFENYLHACMFGVWLWYIQCIEQTICEIVLVFLLLLFDPFLFDYLIVDLFTASNVHAPILVRADHFTFFIIVYHHFLYTFFILSTLPWNRIGSHNLYALFNIGLISGKKGIQQSQSKQKHTHTRVHMHVCEHNWVFHFNGFFNLFLFDFCALCLNVNWNILHWNAMLSGGIDRVRDGQRGMTASSREWIFMCVRARTHDAWLRERILWVLYFHNW